MSAFFIAYEFFYSKNQKFESYPVYILTIILLLSSLTSHFMGYIKDYQELIVYFFSIIFLFISGILIGNYLVKLRSQKLLILSKYSWILITFPLIGKFLPALNLCKDCNAPLFIFLEPSHYVIYISIFLFFSLLTNYKNWILQFIICFFGLIFLYKSLLGLVLLIFILTYYLYIKFNSYKFLGILILFILSSIFAINSGLLFKDFFLRLTFDNSNLTVLTYIGGLQSLIYSLKNYFPSGVGMGNMGLVTFPLEVNYYFELLGRSLLNKYDGSFTFSKIITEMGVFGLLLAGIILNLCYVSFKNFSNSTKYLDNELLIKSALGASISLSILIQSVARGGGTISLYTVFIGIAYVINKYIKEKLFIKKLN